MEGGTTFTFVTDGIESALEQARAAAGDKDVHVAGGAESAQQYLAAGLLDELQLHVAPLLLGDGVRLFDHLGTTGPRARARRVIASPTVTHLALPRREVTPPTLRPGSAFSSHSRQTQSATLRVPRAELRRHHRHAARRQMGARSSSTRSGSRAQRADRTRLLHAPPGCSPSSRCAAATRSARASTKLRYASSSAAGRLLPEQPPPRSAPDHSRSTSASCTGVCRIRASPPRSRRATRSRRALLARLQFASPSPNVSRKLPPPWGGENDHPGRYWPLRNSVHLSSSLKSLFAVIGSPFCVV